MKTVTTLVILINLTFFLDIFSEFLSFFLSCHDFFHPVYVEHLDETKFIKITRDDFTDLMCTYLRFCDA